MWVLFGREKEKPEMAQIIMEGTHMQCQTHKTLNIPQINNYLRKI